MKEIYKSKNDLSPPLIDDVFQVRKINYNLRDFQKIANTKKNSVKMGLETIHSFFISIKLISILKLRCLQK